MSVKWSLGGTPLELNPIGETTDRRKRINYIGILQGEDVLQEGEPETPTKSCEIVAISEAAKEQFETWYNTSGTLTLVDDHNDSFTVLIESLSLQRQFATNTQYYYTGTLVLRILN